MDSRIKAYALRIIRLYGALPKGVVAQILGKQMLRSGTSVGAHYREACHGRSRAEFVSKIEVGLQELSETSYWLDLLVEAEIMPFSRLKDLVAESKELTAILVASLKTAKQKRQPRISAGAP